MYSYIKSEICNLKIYNVFEKYILKSIPNFFINIIVFLKRKFLKMPVYIISYPKCGRTWLRTLIGKYLCEKYKFPDKFALYPNKITSNISDVNSIFFTHDGSNVKSSRKYKNLSLDKSKYQNTKIIFLIRNVKDLLVSCYFHAKKRVKIFEGEISEFIRSDNHGIKKIIRFYNIWYKNKAVPENFLIIKYEDLHKNPTVVLKETLKFIGIKRPKKKLIEKAIRFSSFKNMKKMEKEDFFESRKLRPGNKEDEESYKVRKGKVHGYTEYLSDKDLDYINYKIKKIKCPMIDIYY